MSRSSTDSASHYLQKWQLKRDGSAIHVAAAILYPVTRNGLSLMLKIPFPGKCEHNSFLTLSHYSGGKAVEVLECTRDALLMARAMPGATLRHFRQHHGDTAATHIACDVLNALHGCPHDPGMDVLPTIESLGPTFAKARHLQSDLLPETMLSSADRQFRELQDTARSSIVLHGDLHHENILLDDKTGWLAIDPKGFRGDPAYDCAALLKNPLDSPEIADLKCLLSRTQIMSDILGYPQSRILKWAFVHAVLSIIWAVQDQADVGPAWHVAHALDALTNAE